MNTYERLQEEACEDGIEVVDYTFESDRIKGLYCDGVVAIKKDMDSTQKACTLASGFVGSDQTLQADLFIVRPESCLTFLFSVLSRLHIYNISD